MRKPNLSECEKLVARAERASKKSTRAASATDPRGALSAIQKKAGAILADALPQLDTAGLERLQREYETELRRMAAAAKRHTIENAPNASQRLEKFVAAERVALDALPADPFGPNSTVLLKADFIRSWPTPEYLRDSHQAPGVNWVKYFFDSGTAKLGHFHEKVSFYNVWQNPRNVAVLVDVLVRLTAYGHVHCSANATGITSLFGLNNYSQVDISARLSLWALWAEPAPIFVVDTVPLGRCRATGGFFSHSDDESISVYDEDEDEHNGLAPAVATKTGFRVPAGASILIEASIAVDYELEFGAMNVDFASEDLYNAGWAYAVVTLPPQMMVNA